MNRNHTYFDFTSKIQSYLSSEAMNVIFTIGGVNRLDINGEFVYLWSDGKGNGCYSFNLYERDLICQHYMRHRIRIVRHPFHLVTTAFQSQQVTCSCY